MTQIQAQPLLGLNSLLYFLKIKLAQSLLARCVETELVLQIALYPAKLGVHRMKRGLQETRLHSRENVQDILG